VIAGRYTVRARRSAAAAWPTCSGRPTRSSASTWRSSCSSRGWPRTSCARAWSRRPAPPPRSATPTSCGCLAPASSTAPRTSSWSCSTGPNLEQYLREHRDQRLPWRRGARAAAARARGPARRPRAGLRAPRYQDRQHPRHPRTGRPPTAIVIDLGLVKADRALRTPRARRPPRSAACSARPATPRPSRPLGSPRRSPLGRLLDGRHALSRARRAPAVSRGARPSPSGRAGQAHLQRADVARRGRRGRRDPAGESPR
jgi:hypothetical protein